MVKIVKFGGSSLADAEQFKKVASIIESDEARRYVVPSAPGKRFSGDTKVTDMLYHCYDLAESGSDFSELFGEIKARYNDIISGLGISLSLDSEFAVIESNFKAKSGSDYAASRGEYLNGIILADFIGYEFVDAAELIAFDNNGELDLAKTCALIKKRLSDSPKAVIPGFYGAMPDGTVKTFSRGGSDITGSIVACGVQADVYENWTDVSGYLMADPRIIDNPSEIPVITYQELRELSYMGASVFHEDAVFPVRRAGIPINIKNTNAPQDKGTMIVEHTSVKAPHLITGIAGKTGFVAINIEKDRMNSELGFGRRVLEVIEKNGVSFEHMPSGIDTMSVLINRSDFETCEQEILSGIKKVVEPHHLELEDDLALIAVVGREMKSTLGIAARIFTALTEVFVNIKMIDQGSSELNIIIGVRECDYERSIKAIYDEFANN